MQLHLLSPRPRMADDLILYAFLIFESNVTLRRTNIIYAVRFAYARGTLLIVFRIYLQARCYNRQNSKNATAFTAAARLREIAISVYVT